MKQESDDSPFVSKEVNKVVVEHVIKEKTNPTVQRRKLRLFSGNQPTPNGEVNFATWRITAKQVIDDSVIDEKEKKRCLIDSLLIPALNFVKYVASQSTAQDVFDKLVKVYGISKDPKEMLHEFSNIYQQSSQSSSEYLEHLYIDLLEIVDESLDAYDERKIIEELLYQFLRGCFDEDLINKLRLDDRRTQQQIRSFEELFELVKKEEVKRDQKKKRMEKAYKGKRVQQNISTIVKDDAKVMELRALETQYEDFNKRISALETGQKAILDQLSTLSEQLKNAFTTTRSSYPPREQNGASSGTSSLTAPSTNNTRSPQQPSYSRPIRFCYNCGIDNHHMERCRNPANPVLVQDKLKKRFTSQQVANRSETTDNQDDSN